jgi:outer membrane usher protein
LEESSDGRKGIVRHRPGGLSLVLLVGASLLAALCRAGGLPPAPTSLADVGNARLFLELVVNQVNTGRVVEVEQRGGRFFLPLADLHAVGLALPSVQTPNVALDSLTGLHADYDSQNQRLLLDVPPQWLPGQQIGNSQLYPRTPAQSSFGALLNYDLYLNDTDQGGTYLAAWNEVRVFDGWGTLSNTGQYRQNVGASQGSNSLSGYRRYDTTWRYSDDERLLTYEAGDILTSALPWSSSVRLGGVQLSRDFAVRPDLVTYPLPQFAGEAAVPSSVDLFINGYKSSSAQLQPGPYTLTNIPFINGAGEAVVVTTDALGRQVSTSVPFYVTSTLLQKGLSDFSVAAGNLRRQYGVSDFDYGPGASSASLRYGLSNDFTLETHGEASGSFGLGGAGGNLRLGTFGVLNAALSRSQFEGRTGTQTSVGYQFNNRLFGLSYQRQQRHGDYADLSVVDTTYYRLSQRSDQLTGSLNLGTYGSLGLGYFDIRAGDNTRTRLLNLSWSRPLWGNSSLYLSANREIGESSMALQAQIVVPFDLYGTLSTGFERSQTGETRQTVNYGQAVPSQGGVGFNLGYANSASETYRQADLTWRTQSVQLQAGVYGNSNQQTRWGDASGSLVLMDKQVFAANRIDDAFVVVSTGGFKDIPVRYENQLIGSTDSAGHLLVPWTSAYYAGKYEIDPLNLPANVRSPQVEQHVAVRRGSGYLLQFPLTPVVAASIILVDTQQHELALGSNVLDEQNGAVTVVGWDGLVYLENLAGKNSLLVTKADGSSCRAQFELDVKNPQVAQVGPLVCH